MSPVLEGQMMHRLLCEAWAAEHPVQARLRRLSIAVASRAGRVARWLASSDERVRWLVWVAAVITYAVVLAALRSM